MSAELAFDKGQLLGEQGDAHLALLWLARSLKVAPPKATNLQSAIRLGLGAWQGQVNSVRLALPHDGQVQAVAFAPDSTLVTASWNQKTRVVTVRRWNPVTGHPGESLIFQAAGDGIRPQASSSSL